MSIWSYRLAVSITAMVMVYIWWGLRWMVFTFLSHHFLSFPLAWFTLLETIVARLEYIPQWSSLSRFLQQQLLLVSLRQLSNIFFRQRPSKAVGIGFWPSTTRFPSRDILLDLPLSAGFRRSKTASTSAGVAMARSCSKMWRLSKSRRSSTPRTCPKGFVSTGSSQTWRKCSGPSTRRNSIGIRTLRITWFLIGKVAALSHWSRIKLAIYSTRLGRQLMIRLLLSEGTISTSARAATLPRSRMMVARIRSMVCQTGCTRRKFLAADIPSGSLLMGDRLLSCASTRLVCRRTPFSTTRVRYPKLRRTLLILIFGIRKLARRIRR